LGESCCSEPSTAAEGRLGNGHRWGWRSYSVARRSMWCAVGACRGSLEDILPSHGAAAAQLRWLWPASAGHTAILTRAAASATWHIDVAPAPPCSSAPSTDVKGGSRCAPVPPRDYVPSHREGAPAAAPLQNLRDAAAHNALFDAVLAPSTALEFASQNEPRFSAAHRLPAPERPTHTCQVPSQRACCRGCGPQLTPSTLMRNYLGRPACLPSTPNLLAVHCRGVVQVR
jgi:hypothetical protein